MYISVTNVYLAPEEVKRGYQFPSWVLDGYEPVCGFWESKLGRLQAQVLLITESSLQPPNQVFFFFFFFITAMETTTESTEGKGIKTIWKYTAISVTSIHAHIVVQTTSLTLKNRASFPTADVLPTSAQRPVQPCGIQCGQQEPDVETQPLDRKAKRWFHEFP